jgi:hypothetical protein
VFGLLDASMPLHTAIGSIGERVVAMHSISSTVIASDIRSQRFVVFADACRRSAARAR